ncbi:MAG: UDP-N-acetylmuramoyl-tripeptide--D-alanyl-D-alanine ligase [Saprospiraceae bacterium]|nr:UDP-N-acetylmuramoyl-tripeptide--D-alanyl-D-alanine ligase [Saprospiraceae bacterium]
MIANIENLYQIFKKYPLICTDSRKITEGVIFFALKGANFDGNLFAENALKSGAVYAVVDDPNLPRNERFIFVNDVLTTLQQLATHHRRQFDFPIIAIAGSNGKTTTKELVAAVMSSQYQAHFTKGNFNNHIGVPLTLLELTDEHEVAIIEIGANHPQEHLDLCQIAEPTHGVVTNMGKDHLEGFGGFEGVKKANAEVFDWLAAHKGTIFVNDDEPFLADFLPKGARVINYGRQDEPSLTIPKYEIALKSANPFLEIGYLNSKGEMIFAQTQLVGVHNFANIATAVAIGKYFKVPTARIKDALETYKPANMRSQLLVHKSGATILLDAYNANPSSMALALQTLKEMPQLKKVAIIGDMRELGEATESEHKDIFSMAKSLNFNQLVTVGDEFFVLNDSNTEGVVSFKNNDEARAWFEAQTFDADTCVLLKGSRGLKLEMILAEQ